MAKTLALEDVTTAEGVAEALQQNGSEQTLAMIGAHVVKAGTLCGETLVLARLSRYSDEQVRPKVLELLGQYFPRFDASNVLIEDIAVWDK